MDEIIQTSSHCHPTHPTMGTDDSTCNAHIPHRWRKLLLFESVQRPFDLMWTGFEPAPRNAPFNQTGWVRDITLWGSVIATDKNAAKFCGHCVFSLIRQSHCNHDVCSQDYVSTMDGHDLTGFRWRTFGNTRKQNWVGPIMRDMIFTAKKGWRPWPRCFFIILFNPVLAAANYSWASKRRCFLVDGNHFNKLPLKPQSIRKKTFSHHH